jgi:hypothetical protein
MPPNFFFPPSPPPAVPSTDVFISIDFGKTKDYTAAVLIERQGLPVVYYITHARRWKLGTSYALIVNDVERLLRSGQVGDAYLCLDNTGVGAGPCDELKARLPEWRSAGRIKPVNITGGSAVSLSDVGVWNIPKLELCGTVGMLLGTRTLRIAAGMELAEVIRKELEEFTSKIDRSGHETLEAWRTSSAHDDLVLAAAIGLYFARRVPRPFGDNVPVQLTEGRGDPFRETTTRPSLPPVPPAEVAWLDF